MEGGRDGRKEEAAACNTAARACINSCRVRASIPLLPSLLPSPPPSPRLPLSPSLPLSLPPSLLPSLILVLAHETVKEEEGLSDFFPHIPFGCFPGREGGRERGRGGREGRREGREGVAMTFNSSCA